MLFFQKKVDAQIVLRHHCGVLYREVADARKHEVLEGFEANNAGSRV